MELELIETRINVALTMSVEAIIFILLLLLVCRMAAGPDMSPRLTPGCRCDTVPEFIYGEYNGMRAVCEQNGKRCPWAPKPRPRAASPHQA